MEYQVVEATNSITNLTQQVNELIKEGWKPQGGVVVLDTRDYWLFCQAMIKES